MKAEGQIFQNKGVHSPLCLLLLGTCLFACGDQSSPTRDASPDIDGTSSTADAAIPPSVDASTVDASPSPDAVLARSCQAPLELGLGDSHLGDTGASGNNSEADCSPGSSSAPDAVYRVQLPDTPSDLLAKITSLNEGDSDFFDPVLSIRSECDTPASAVACSDQGISEHAVALAQSGEVFIHVDGTAQFGGKQSGAYQLDLRHRTISNADESCDPALQTSRCAVGLRCVDSSCQTDSQELACNEALEIAGQGQALLQTHAFHPDYFQASCAADANAAASERILSFSLAQISDLEFRTDLPGSEFDTVLSLRSSCTGSEIACHDDIDAGQGNFRSRLQVTGLTPGDYILIVDGSSSQSPGGFVELRWDIRPQQ